MLFQEYFHFRKTSSKIDLLIIDEFDDLIMKRPYTFTENTSTTLEGIWNLKSEKVLGITGTSTEEMVHVVEDNIIAAPETLI